jgi:hypothetical protein
MFGQCFVVSSCLFLFGQRSDVWIGMFRQCFVVSSCLFADRSAVPLADWDIQTVFCGEQLPFESSVSDPMGGLGFSDIVLR